MDKPYQPAARPHAGAAELTPRASHAGPERALDDALRALITAPAIVEAFAATTGAALTEVAVDWPRRVARDDLARWLRTGDVLVELTRPPAREPLALGLVLHAESATQWVERVLGGTGSSAIPSAAGALSEAECGVLAYAAARLCAAHPSAFAVRDVRVAPPPHALPEAVVLWPLALRTGFATLAGLVLLSPTLAASAPAQHRVELLLRDVLEDGAPLAPGDVLTSDGWCLTDTTEGLTGPVRIATRGTATELNAQLARGAVIASTPAPTPRPDEVTLVLASRVLSLAQIASLCAGEACAFPDIGEAAMQLRRGDVVLAEGEPIVHRGAFGLRILAT